MEDRYLRYRKGNEGREFWRCCLRTCAARATTVGDQLEAVRGEHSHAPNSAKNKAEKVVATMRKRAREEVETVPAIYIDALQGVAIDEDSEAVAAHLPTLSSVESALYRSRKTKFPPLPQT